MLRVRSFQLNDTMLLKWLLQLFSLSTDEKRISKSEKCWHLLKCSTMAVTLAALDVYALIWKSNNIFLFVNTSIVITDVIQMCYDYCQYMVDLFFIYKYGREISKEYLKNYECIDTFLDSSHHAEIMTWILKLTCLFVVSWLATSAFDFYAWAVAYGMVTSLIYSLAYVFLLIKMLTNLDMTVQVMNIECRLRVLGDLLQDTYNTCDSLTIIPSMRGTINDFVTNKNWFYGSGYVRARKINSRIHPLKNEPHTIRSFHEVKWLTRCYLLLIEQSNFINSMFGIRILLNSLSLLIDMVRFLNIVVRIIVGSQKTTYDAGWLPGLSTLGRFWTVVAGMFSLVHHCEQAYAQADRIVSVADHILINKNPDAALRSSLGELRSLVLSRPVSFVMANFFRLSYTFLVSMMSVVVTYTIILLQTV